MTYQQSVETAAEDIVATGRTALDSLREAAAEKAGWSRWVLLWAAEVITVSPNVPTDAEVAGIGGDPTLVKACIAMERDIVAACQRMIDGAVTPPQCVLCRTGIGTDLTIGACGCSLHHRCVVPHSRTCSRCAHSIANEK